MISEDRLSFFLLVKHFVESWNLTRTRHFFRCIISRSRSCVLLITTIFRFDLFPKNSIYFPCVVFLLMFCSCYFFLFYARFSIGLFYFCVSFSLPLPHRTEPNWTFSCRFHKDHNRTNDTNGCVYLLDKNAAGGLPTFYFFGTSCSV